MSDTFLGNMLNFRKLKQDFSSNILKDGRTLFEDQKVLAAKIGHLDDKALRITSRIVGQYDNVYESEIEIDRFECELVDSNCDCPYNYDCTHLAALLFFLEKNLDEILVAYSKETNIEELAEQQEIEDDEKEKLLEQIKTAESKEIERQKLLYEEEVLQEYISTANLLAGSPFFRVREEKQIDKAEFLLIFAEPKVNEQAMAKGWVDMQIALRLPARSKPLFIPNVKRFFDAMRYEESINLGGKRYVFSLESFDEYQCEMVRMILENARYTESKDSERAHRVIQLEATFFGIVLEMLYTIASTRYFQHGFTSQDDDLPPLGSVYKGNLENVMRFSPKRANFRFALEYIAPPVSKMLLNPQVSIDQESIELEEVSFFASPKPGMLYNGVYYRFVDYVTRSHLRDLNKIREMTIPEPLFGSFVENALPQLRCFAEFEENKSIEKITTLPYTHALKATCEIAFLDGELDAALFFHYDDQKIPALPATLTFSDISSFKSEEGILARNLVEERRIIEDLFQDFLYNEEQGVFISRSEKKIVEFMTEVIPRNQHHVEFNCPQNLLDQVIYDDTTFSLKLSHTDRIDTYQIELKVNGPLKGVKIDRLWECMASRKSYIELEMPRSKAKKSEGNKLPKILVLDLEQTAEVVKVFDELGVEKLDNHTLKRPLWSIANIEKSHFDGLPITFSISKQLVEIRKQMLGEKELVFTGKPDEVIADLRPYQLEGINWLERLRGMFLNGILADDMGLGKTLQAIATLTQHHKKTKNAVSLIVCPTSLLYNWKEEFHKFNPKIKAHVIEGVPQARKKMIANAKDYDVVITSYTLLQKDIEIYEKVNFAYVILDEAQHIKNRGTRNAKSVKMTKADYRLILSGTPIENSLDEMWSLFDFLMPGFLSSYERFVEKYVRVTGEEQQKNIEYLRKKVSPFILRRMKNDVLDDLPPVSELIYHCQLSETQMQLYRSYAESARDELVKLVERDGFDRVQIHVLATLTRLKQICCHPAIFAKEKAEPGDSAKYDMLLELLQTLIEGNHKTVIFSQYTRMLQIMRADFEQMGIRFLYLDGSTKNRLDVVKNFNEDDTISVFLVSLKAGGTGLNLVSADTVIHYDMWWNPAVESQATDRVHRIGQTRSVSAYKLITLGTIEEKIAEMQNRKKGLVKKIVSCDDEAIAKLTWEDVLELLKT